MDTLNAKVGDVMMQSQSQSHIFTPLCKHVSVFYLVVLIHGGNVTDSPLFSHLDQSKLPVLDVPPC